MVNQNAFRSTILKKQLWYASQWVPTDALPSLTPQYSERLAAHKAEFGEVLERAKRILAMLDDSDLDENYEPDGSLKDKYLRETWALLQTRMVYFTELNPIYQAGLGNTHYAADYGYWSRMERLELPEALWLSMGLDPRRTWDKDLRIGERVPRKEHREAAHALSLKEQLARFAETQRGGRNDLDAFELRAWIKTTNFPAHTGLIETLDAIARRKGGEEAMASASPVKEPDPREIDSMARILTAIAMREYGYASKKMQSPISKEIEGICDELGLSVSRETIRKYLRRGARLLQQEE